MFMNINRKVMGFFVNNKVTIGASIGCSILLFILNGVDLFPSSCNPYFPLNSIAHWGVWIAITFIGIAYLIMIILVIAHPVSQMEPINEVEFKDEEQARLKVNEASSSEETRPTPFDSKEYCQVPETLRE